MNTAHGTEISRNEHRLRLEQLAEHAADEYGIEPDALVTEYGPDQLFIVPAELRSPPRRSSAARRCPPTVPADTVPADTARRHRRAGL